MSIAEVIKEALWLKRIYSEQCGIKSCITIHCDSQSDIFLAKYQMLLENPNILIFVITSFVISLKKGLVKLCKISTHNNPADMMTKHVSVAKFELCSNLVGIIN